ncbi:hypothetical protein [Armatimonas sp.]|uniref:hypothetical protein n=1 Tax=Armatimonas sp. TaxID=1872638 RepID=UPI00374D187A
MPEHYERLEDLKDEATDALEDGDLTLARQLAQTLLSRGERDIVLEYLELVTGFWGMHKPTSSLLFVLLFRYNLAQNTRKLARWKAAIQAGEQPRLNRVGLV